MPPIAWMAERVGGEAAEVWSFLEKGQGPHHFEAKPSQMRRLEEADIYLRVGLPFEEVLLEKIQALYPRLKVVDLDEGVELIVSTGGCVHCSHEAHEHHHDAYDPHYWMDPLRAAQMMAHIREALIEEDPSHAADFRLRYLEGKAQLEEVDRELAEWLEPVRGMRFYVYHPALAYFAQRYGLEERAIESEGKAPGPRELMRLMKEAKGARVLFSQPQFDNRSVGMLADAIGAQVEVLDPLAYDYPDNLKRIGAKIMMGLQLEKLDE